MPDPFLEPEYRQRVVTDREGNRLAQFDAT
jgi:hypothetical protein